MKNYDKQTIVYTAMPTTQTYSPLIPTFPIPAGYFATHCVRCGTVVTRTEAKGEYGRQEPRWGYVARCAPPIFHLLFRINGMPSLLLRPTANYSLLTANSSYTFSAKEKDSETGLSYFGSRYYSSDLSIWLSVDPQASKYPHQSNYVYCGNNPLKVIDPNGEDEWEVNEITGQITHCSNNKPDRLFVTTAGGQRRDDVDPLDVDKSIMDHMLADDTKTAFFIADKRDEMDKLFDYLADNTYVEWSHIGASYIIDNKEGFNTINNDMVFTRHQFTSCNMWFCLEEFASNGVLDFHKHSHPNKYLGMNPYYRIMYPGTSHIPSRNDYKVKNSYPIPEVPFKQPFFLLRNGKRNIYY